MEKIPDSQWLASMVAAAYSEQRYELGEALARLCGQAYRMERSRQLSDEPVDPKVYASLREHTRVQPTVQPAAPAPDSCVICGVGIKWSQLHQHWFHVNGEGGAVTSPLPAHEARPTTRNESNAPPVTGDAPTLVTPSAVCIAQVSHNGHTTQECHGVLYWDTQEGMPAGWMHLNSDLDGHVPVANRPNPEQL